MAVQVSAALLQLIVAVQSFVVGGLLLFVLRPYAGQARRSVALRGAAMWLQAGGYLWASFYPLGDGYLNESISYGLTLAGQAASLFALRVLLELRPYSTIIVCSIAFAWVLYTLGCVADNDALFMVVANGYPLLYACAAAWPLLPALKKRRYSGTKVVFCMYALMALTQMWLVAEEWLPIHEIPLQVILAMIALMPTVSGIGFLFMYYERRRSEESVFAGHLSTREDSSKRYITISAEEVLLYNALKPSSPVEVRNHWLILDSEWRLIDHDFSENEFGVLAGELIFLVSNGLLSRAD